MHLLAWEFLVLLFSGGIGYALMRFNHSGTIAAGYSGLGQDLGVGAIILGLAYVFLHEAITNYYYSYEIAYRAALMILWDDVKKNSSPPPS